MINEKIDALIEQTFFLIEKQKELFDKSFSYFDSLISLVDSELKNVNMDEDLPEIEDLKFIYDYLLKKKDKICEPIKEDIDFLNEQLEAIKKINKMQDPKKAESVLNMILPEDEKLLETQIFKDQILKDLHESDKEFEIMFDDLKNAIEQRDWHNLKLTFEAMESEDEEKNVDEEESSECLGCSGYSSENDYCSELDIFSELKQEDKNEDD
ncbi:hypothetical protein KAT08_01695 [Candidatus Babeliales bacterium]|nr:hypothetical protein [Candidatus Babeliales bacterium]